MTCRHIITQSRVGEDGSWCVGCGEKIYDVDERECKDCLYHSRLPGGSICRKHLMVVVPGMHVTFRIADGSCFTPALLVTDGSGT